MSYMSSTEFAPAGSIQALSFDEIDSVAGGPGPVAAVAGAGAVGGVIGGGAALVNELTDGRPGVDIGNVAIGAAAGAGAGVSAVLGVGAAIAGGIGFSTLGAKSIETNNEINGR